MRTTFFDDHDKNITGVAYKNIHIKKTIILYFADKGNTTITELCKELNLSVPKVTTLVLDLIADGLVKDFGKTGSTGGRRPNIYGLAPDSVFFLGVDVKYNHINIGLTDLRKKLIRISKGVPYDLQNSEASLKELCRLILNFIKETGVPKEKILGIGLNMSGRINYLTGYSYNFFHFNEEPLNKVIENELGLKTYLENDSRAMAYGEFNSGAVEDEKNVLFLNLDYGLGMGMMINKEIYYGKSGFSGELGHIPLFNNELICRCGKKGCLETEASGMAMVRMFKESISNGSSSSLKKGPNDEIQMEEIIDAANNDDVLCIELMEKIGYNLGRGIALLINIFNPELIILGGALATTGEYLHLPIKSALNKLSLSLANNDTQIRISSLGEDAGVIGACLLARKRLLEDTL
ncbi:putative xylose repressor [Pedobacter sp. BAL39]|uniref:ROK family transcriptional regulator n=1 Tax=Pedobacter sp. BAL39 TaxID=391596 RepID=UPI0001559311|nr:ROK family transcriptional regulator [Pedobacter sp. BAL39]EDM36133.1 putative xylose repressor [Pedobacter sp. BAL39]